MKQFILTGTLLLWGFVGLTQNHHLIQGTVRDTLGNSLIATTVRLTSAQDTLMTRTDIDGNFIIRDIKSTSFMISVTSLGYKPFFKSYSFQDKGPTFMLPIIILQSQAKQLSEVVISGTPPITVKEDTLIYHAGDYKLKSDAVTEDLLKKLPGVSVDNTGSVTAQGQNVTKVRINGKDYFGGDLKTVTQNIPADMIDKVQIIDDYGDQANITGIKTGDPDKVLDIHIRPDKNKGYMGRGTLGQGTDGRYQASAAVNYLNNTQQISFLGNFNNTNTSSFNLGNGVNIPHLQQLFGGGNSAGISNLSSVGINYRDDWSKKLSSYGSYSYADNIKHLLNSSVQQNNYQGTSVLNSQEMNNQTITNSHRLNWNLEYKIDTLNYLKISPTFTYDKSTIQASGSSILQNNGIQLPSIISNSQAETGTPNLGGKLLFNHRFAKHGRNISLALSLNTSANNQDQDVTTNSTNTYQRQTQHIDSYTPNYTANLSYLEPLSLTSLLEFNYARYRATYDNSRISYNINPAGIVTLNGDLSNNYDYSFTTDRIGINYRVNQKRYNYYIGVAVQPAVLKGESTILNTPTRNTEFRFIPGGRFSYNFSKTRALNVGIFGKSIEPTYAQLQPSIDNSNPLFPIQGNPNLSAQFNQMLRIKYNNFHFDTGDLLLTTLSATYIGNKIVTNTIKLPGNGGNIVQQTNYLNADGYYTITGLYLWSKPFAEKKYVLSFNGSINYNNNISYSNGERNTGKNWVFTQSIYPQINPYDWLELNPGATYSYNTTANDLLAQTDTRVSTWTFSFNSKTYLHKTWLIGTDMNKVINQGYNSIGLNPFILNLYLEKQFLKGNRASLRIQGYDLLDQNTSVSRAVTANSITDNRSNQLGRYFMLSFTLRLQKFNGINAANLLMPSEPAKNKEGGPFR